MSDYWNRWQQRRFGRRGFIASAGATGIGAAALGLVGCGDDDDSGDSGSSGDGGTGTSTATEVSIDDLRNMSLEDIRERFGGKNLKNLPGAGDTPVTGGTLSLDVEAAATGTDPRIGGLNPQGRSAVALSYTQPLLQGAGAAANLAPIVIARINTEIAMATASPKSRSGCPSRKRHARWCGISGRCVTGSVR